MSEDPAPSRDYRAFEAGVRALAKSLTPLAARDEVVERLFNEHQQQFDAARLYYEAHLTVEPGQGSFDEFRQTYQSASWRVSTFSEDDVDNIVGKWFITSRAESQQQMIAMVRDMRADLEAAGLTVLRAKIEDTVLDTKHGDVL